MSKLRLITFDVTNTLIHMKNTIGFEYLQIAEFYGIKNIKTDRNANQLENELSKAFKTVWKDMNNKYPNYGLSEGMASHEWWSLLIKDTFRLAQCNDNHINDRQLKVISSHLYKHYSCGKCWAIDPNSHQLLSYLKQKHSNLLIGVISNFDERLEKILYEVGLRHYFDFVLISRLVKFVKPYKQIFDLALNEAKLENGLKALHIGDDFELDYLAAKTNGWNALLLKQQNQLSAQQLLQINNNEIISNLNELKEHEIFGFK
jgi:REG-2-like HAD superfamily hydrolase